MKVYLMRHGIAANPLSRGTLADEQRPLTDQGRERTEQIANAFQRMDCRADRIWSSPLLRARETAEILAGALGIKVFLADFLRPGGDPRAALEALQARPDLSGLMVGHMPDLALLAAFLLPGIHPAGLTFRKAGIAEIEFDERPSGGGGRLNWLMQPRQFLRTADPSE